jgi:hypothetical protein
MSDYLRRLRRLGRSDAREEVERLLREHFPRLLELAPVADAAMRLGGGPLQVTHYTFDEPDLDEREARVLFTYHLGERPTPGHQARVEEVRGTGLAVIDQDGELRFEDVDAEPYRMVDDVPDQADED